MIYLPVLSLKRFYPLWELLLKKRGKVGDFYIRGSSLYLESYTQLTSVYRHANIPS